ncbi:HU family DNA-binding protein [Pseudomonas veronii]|uniref:HU family DNA-binding protein n=1 Tax=Pseudomonas veronii TaxID=76761 RepID=UPI0021C02583|nr:HU family DNA-binding protein [Pseudomonas veronii]MCT9825976.1 HU family DNA-binding protein [Pseudomonas veronii]
MNKYQLVEKVSASADVSKVAAGKAVDALIDAITTTLKDGGTVTLVGFGTFSVANRPERIGRNPQSGKPMTLQARRAATFRAGKSLKESVN